MAGHKYAQVLKWIADGEQVQFQTSAGIWEMQDWKITLEEIVASEYALGRYRLKPRTLTIGGVSVEAPLSNAEKEQIVYVPDSVGEISTVEFADTRNHKTALANGRLFATPEAAKAAYDAITALLTGKDAA